MKKNRMLALALAFAMTMPLLLTACSKEEPKPSSEVDAGIFPPGNTGGGLMIIPVPTFSMDEEIPDGPTESADEVPPEESSHLANPPESQTAQPSPEATPQVTPEPTLAPVATPTPEATPSPTPTPVPTPDTTVPGAPAPSLTAAQVYNKVVAAATDTYMVDSSFVLDAFYPGLSEADFEDFVLYMPDASAKIEEILIGKVVSGRMENVKTACQSRIQGMKEDAEFYATTGDYVDDYRLVVSGDWILFLVAPNAAAGETAFTDYTK